MYGILDAIGAAHAGIGLEVRERGGEVSFLYFEASSILRNLQAPRFKGKGLTQVLRFPFPRNSRAM